jgi:hypothetical protein
MKQYTLHTLLYLSVTMVTKEQYCVIYLIYKFRTLTLTIIYF